MKRADRLELIKEVLDVFLGSPVDKTFLTIESADHPDDYVQFIFHDGGVLYGEVGSHGWSEDAIPLAQRASQALMKLGFTGGGRRKNFKSDTLAQDSEWLAGLVERAFVAGYGMRHFADPVFATTHQPTAHWLQKVEAWVRAPTLPPNRRLVHVTIDTIRELLEGRGLKVFADAEGGLMTFWGWKPEYGTEVKLWFRLESDGEIYSISATSDRPLPVKGWNGARVRCNEWNSKHRWPKAHLCVVSDGKREGGFLELAADLPVGCGTSPCMLDDFTSRAVKGSFEFFTWWQGATRPASKGRRSHPPTTDVMPT